MGLRLGLAPGEELGESLGLLLGLELGDELSAGLDSAEGCRDDGCEGTTDGAIMLEQAPQRKPSPVCHGGK